MDMDLVFMVLTLLPIESIFRCATVCKSWYMVTKDPYFLKQVSRFQNKKTHIVLQPILQNIQELHLINVQERKSRNLPLKTILHKLKVMSSCKGMLSMGSTTKLDPSVIYNPLTRETLILPSNNSRPNMPSLVFYHYVGIGYDYTTEKYKVLRAFSVHYTSRFTKNYEVLTLGEGETATWRRLCCPKCIGHLDNYDVSYCEGSFYFISKPGNFLKVVQFNLSNEKFFQVVCQNTMRKMKHNFSNVYDDDKGSVFLVVGKEDRVGLFKLGNNEVPPMDPVFKLQNLNIRTGPEWVYFNLLTQLDIDKYLVHLGFSDDTQPGLRIEVVGEYHPNPTESEYSNLCAYKLWNNPKSYSFKPSLLPLPRAIAPP